MRKILPIVAIIVAPAALAERPPKPQGITYDTVIVKSNTSVLRQEGTGEPVDITVRKGDRLEYRSTSDEGWIVRLFSPSDWVLPKGDGTRDQSFKPKTLGLSDKRTLYGLLKAAKQKAEAASKDKDERNIAMDAACLDIFRQSGQPTAVQREVMVIGISQGW